MNLQLRLPFVLLNVISIVLIAGATIAAATAAAITVKDAIPAKVFVSRRMGVMLACAILHLVVVVMGCDWHHFDNDELSNTCSQQQIQQQMTVLNLAKDNNNHIDKNVYKYMRSELV